MSETFAKSTFPSQYAKLEKQRENAKNRPLAMSEINVLLLMGYNNKPLYESIDLFYTEEYREALKNNVNAAELDKIVKFRAGTDEEINLLYSDIHAREDKVEMSGASANP